MQTKRRMRLIKRNWSKKKLKSKQWKIKQSRRKRKRPRRKNSRLLIKKLLKLLTKKLKRSLKSLKLRKRLIINLLKKQKQQHLKKIVTNRSVKLLQQLSQYLQLSKPLNTEWNNLKLSKRSNFQPKKILPNLLLLNPTRKRRNLEKKEQKRPKILRLLKLLKKYLHQSLITLKILLNLPSATRILSNNFISFTRNLLKLRMTRTNGKGNSAKLKKHWLSVRLICRRCRMMKATWLLRVKENSTNNSTLWLFNFNPRRPLTKLFRLKSWCSRRTCLVSVEPALTLKSKLRGNQSSCLHMPWMETWMASSTAFRTSMTWETVWTKSDMQYTKTSRVTYEYDSK